MRASIRFLKQTIRAWISCDPLTTGAALSFYLLFSLPTALIVALTVAGILVSPGLLEVRLVHELTLLFGREPAAAMKLLIDESHRPYAGIIASSVGVIAVIWGSLGAFGQLEKSLKKIWRIPRDRVVTFKTLVKERMAAFLMVIMLGFLLAASFLASTIVSVFGTTITHYIPTFSSLVNVANLVLSVILITCMFVLIYSALPGLRVKWSASILGALITSFIFMAGRTLMSLYLSSRLITTGYGAVSIITVLLLWSFISAQIFLLGAAITHVIDQRLKGE